MLEILDIFLGRFSVSQKTTQWCVYDARTAKAWHSRNSLEGFLQAPKCLLESSNCNNHWTFARVLINPISNNIMDPPSTRWDTNGRTSCRSWESSKSVVLKLWRLHAVFFVWKKTAELDGMLVCLFVCLSVFFLVFFGLTWVCCSGFPFDKVVTFHGSQNIHHP